ncbi:cytochrome c oxidase assembly protein [Arthrobacter agilis]|uniref:cytochrome c oxidase assembly protein n=1 Tax=Arthrobacter agilis TaxID=37921 RepID=UPI0027813E33|nr:cytochrome c oxidase assembly protein [Arthrobacter agilis]MDQ0736337.1 putative membrane protein [Arthrobacter agilis]
MTEDSHHPGGADAGTGALGMFAQDTAVVLVWLGLAVLYLLAGRAAALRGRTGWPPVRTAAWLTGTGLGLAATAGPLARAADSSFTAHTAVHLLLGMLVPLLLVLGAPMTAALRAVPVAVGRRLTRLAGSAPVRLVSHPLVAALITTAPMALLYWDAAALTLLHHPVVGPLLHVHFVAAGALFAYAVVGVDADPHRAAAWVRGAVITASIAAHAVIAKHLYASAGQAGRPADTEQAAQLMYYGGDAVHVLLLGVFCAQVYRRSGRLLRRTASPPSGRLA